MTRHSPAQARLLGLVTASLLVTVIWTSGCKDGGDTDDLSAECGDPDGNGGDTGDVPNLLGDWTGNYGQRFVDGNCRAEDVPTELLDFLEQPFLLEGSVTSARITFADNSAYVLRGVAAPTGAMAMSGVVSAGNVNLHTAVGGMVYEDGAGRTRWDGGIFIGADLNEDAVIDCEFNADWTARKSGT